jgi:hypothetical protein
MSQLLALSSASPRAWRKVEEIVSAVTSAAQLMGRRSEASIERAAAEERIEPAQGRDTQLPDVT